MTTTDKYTKTVELIDGGMTVAKACKKTGISYGTYYAKKNATNTKAKRTKTTFIQDFKPVTISGRTPDVAFTITTTLDKLIAALRNG